MSCAEGTASKEEAVDSGSAGEGEGEGEGEGDAIDGLRPLTEPSGTCPDLTTSGFISFESAGQTRNASIVVPSAPSGPMSAVFFFHGLMDPSSTPEPTEAMVDGLDLQGLADSYDAVIILPEAPLLNLFGFNVFLWDISLETDADLVLFDDLRACSADQLDIDLARTTAWGFSGGALWTTVIAAQRGDAFAAIVEASGGSDIDVPIWTELGAAYQTPAHTMPALLMSGGDSDVWPNASLTLVDFDAATDTLESQLVSDGHLVVRCRHTAGHTLTSRGFSLTIDWLMEHTFGEPSPWSSGDLGDDADWCDVSNADG
jgi:predicted esterase